MKTIQKKEPEKWLWDDVIKSNLQNNNGSLLGFFKRQLEVHFAVLRP